MKILIINQPLKEMVSNHYDLLIALTVSETNIKNYFTGKYLIITDTGVIYRAGALQALSPLITPFKLNGLDMYIADNTVYSSLSTAMQSVVSTLVLKSLKDPNITLGGEIKSILGKESLITKSFVLTYEHKGEEISLELDNLKELVYSLIDCYTSRAVIKSVDVVK